ncbi:hypothetical protein LIER_31801 [Lithospermum erythrorhizon]|uniref:Retrovirus-related Pol polyprotein from transposon TNT 1-94-like beta-barrel domain-containing protein n=1 Tax=Lithospermum erythrorhizon TaxID=34254 RepID=A0AAV3RS52_LITER
MKLDEIFLANVLLEKFLPSWSEYKNHLKHKKKDMPLRELISHMRIEEANLLKDKLDRVTPHNSTNANLVKIRAPSNVNRFKGKTKMKQQYWQFKKLNQNKFPKSDSKIKKHPVVEANLIANANDWVLDTGASRHLCANKEMFQDFEEVADGDYVYMGNSITARITSKGKVSLKLTPGKTLTLSNVLYFPTLHRNLVSGALLNKTGLKLVFEADKVVLSCSGEFVGNGYLSGGLFILNVEYFINKNDSTSAYIDESSTYITESLNVWHGRLGHVNIVSIKRFRNLSIIYAL